MIVVYKTLEELENLEETWKDLFSRSENVTPFQSYAFCHSALPLLSGNLYITAWFRKDKLHALFPLYLDSSGTLRFINDRHSDFCGPLVTKESEGDFHMCREFAEHIMENKAIKRVRFENMRFDLFQSSLQFQLKGSVLFGYSRYSFFRIPGMASEKSSIDALGNLSTKEKYRLKNISSKMQKVSAEWRCFDNSDSDAWPEELVSKLTGSMIESGIRKKKYFSPEYLSFIKGVYDSGSLMIFATYVQSNPVSCNLFLKNGDEYIDWMAFYTEPSYNAWNLLQFISWLHGKGGGSLNFARGIYMYKLHNFRPVLRNLDRLRFSKSFFGKVSDIVGCAISEIKRMHR